jgi:NADH:ubiquinone oxidoreductase subunit F (NADH-binding)/(2Fe-2S) ferredoxin/NAD-dependent dihydropyrimidine dehydrogenase PreA subunit
VSSPDRVPAGALDELPPLPPGEKRCVHVCQGTGCLSAGSGEIARELAAETERRGLGDRVEIKNTGCHGFCQQGPIVVVEPEGTFYRRVKPGDVPEIAGAHLEGNGILRRLLYRDPVRKRRIASWRDIDFYRKQTRIILRNCGRVDPERIEDYEANGGYAALRRVVAGIPPEDVIDEIRRAGLRGRGGAGFPTATKWETCRNARRAARIRPIVVCNADEGDPGAFMDRSVLEGDPHTVVEGLTLAGYAVGAREGIVYCRAEYPLALRRVRAALDAARERGYLGRRILGSSFEFDIRVFEGAGAFVCGEETALIGSLEGRRGMPRARPPYPALHGLHGRPTAINNVKTLASVPVILERGADAYAAIGTETSKGTAVFALTGRVANSGLVEVPMGTTLETILYDIGGGVPRGKSFKAVQIGGPSGGCLPARLLHLPVDFDSLREAGAMMGSGGLVVMDDDTCMVDVAKFFLSFTRNESCGKCVPCRVGTEQLVRILERIVAGVGTERDLDRLERLSAVVGAASLCGLGRTAPNPVLTALRYFRAEFESHVSEKRCPAVVCRDLVTYRVIAEKCVGCGRCVEVCPTGALTGPRKKPHRLDATKCIKCRSCFEVCRFDAIAGDAIVIESRGREHAESAPVA